MKIFFACLFASILAIIAPASFAAPVAFVTAPTGTYYEYGGILTQNINAAFPNTQGTTFCTGTTTATCTGLRIAVSYSGLTTAAGVTSALQTVTDTSVTAASQIFCQVNGYAGTGNPLVTNIIPAAGSFTYQLQNTHASAALNATVVSNCLVYN